MAEFNLVYSKIWSDKQFRSLSTEERYLFMYLLTNDKATFCGIYELDLNEIEYRTGIKQSEIKPILTKISSNMPVLYDSEKDYIFLLNKFRYVYNKNSPKIKSCVLAELSRLHNDNIFKKRFLEEYNDYFGNYKPEKKETVKKPTLQEEYAKLKIIYPKSNVIIKNLLTNQGFSEAEIDIVMGKKF